MKKVLQSKFTQKTNLYTKEHNPLNLKPCSINTSKRKKLQQIDLVLNNKFQNRK
jgi:hypothetical protein